MTGRNQEKRSKSGKSKSGKYEKPKSKKPSSQIKRKPNAIERSRREAQKYIPRFALGP